METLIEVGSTRLLGSFCGHVGSPPNFGTPPASEPFAGGAPPSTCWPMAAMNTSRTPATFLRVMVSLLPGSRPLHHRAPPTPVESREAGRPEDRGHSAP